jgi:hypothetical protein
MRGVLGSFVVIVAAIGAILAPVQAQDNAAAAMGAGPATEIRTADLKAPWNFAPPEQIVVGRDLMSFRKEGTLLAKTSREIPTVDEKELLERKYAMYDGQRFHLGLSRAGERGAGGAAAPGKNPAAAATPPAEGTPSYWLPWSLAAFITAVVLAAWRKGWFVPFSARSAEQRRALRVASIKAGSRAAKGPPRKVRPPSPGG